MSRLILLILIGLIANWFWRNLHKQREGSVRGQGDARRGSPFAQKPAQALPEPMVRCAHCDTHLPVSEATMSGGRHFCNPRHAHEYAMRAAQAGDGR